MTESERLLVEWRQRIDRVLDERLPDEQQPPEILHRAMRYSALAGGKRFRPVLVYATGQALVSYSL